MWLFGTKKSTGNAAEVKTTGPTANQLPEALRSKLVLTFGENQGGLLKRSCTDDLVRPGTLLGKGSFGTVKLRHDKHSGEPRAVKTMDKPAHWDRTRLVHEAVVMQSLDHPHLSRIFGWQDSGDSITMVMEFCAGGEFLDSVSKAKREGEVMRESWSAVAFKQLFEAMAYCAGRGLVHMDIKSGNILLLNACQNEDIRNLFKAMPHVVVADLGLAQVLDPTSSWFRKKLAGDAKGTPATMAPEVWKGDIGPKADIWGLGCILYELVCQRLPYFPADPDDQRQKTWENLYRVAGDDAKQRLEVCGCSEEAKHLCMRLLTVDHKDRPTAKECLVNTWFQRFLPSFPIDDESQVSDFRKLSTVITKWSEMQHLHKSVCLKVAAECKGSAKFASVFSNYDSDRNGVLSKQEVMAAVQSLGITEAKAWTVAQALDYNNDGTCEYLEFAAACLPCLEEEYEEALHQEFSLLDSYGDNRGKLSKNSVRIMLEKLRPICEPTSYTIEEALVLFKADKEGLIGFPEFRAALGGRPIEEAKPPARTSQPRQASKEQKKPDPNDVQYFSKSHGKWLDTRIIEKRDDGSVQLSIKPGFWVSIQDQAESLRCVDGTPYIKELPAGGDRIKPVPKHSGSGLAKPKAKSGTPKAGTPKALPKSLSQMHALNKTLSASELPDVNSLNKQHSAADLSDGSKKVIPGSSSPASSSRRGSERTSADVTGKGADNRSPDMHRAVPDFVPNPCIEAAIDAPAVPSSGATMFQTSKMGLSPQLYHTEEVRIPAASLPDGADCPPPPVQTFFESERSAIKSQALAEEALSPSDIKATAFINDTNLETAGNQQNGLSSSQSNGIHVNNDSQHIDGAISPNSTTTGGTSPASSTSAAKSWSFFSGNQRSKSKPKKAAAKSKQDKIKAGSDVFPATPEKVKPPSAPPKKQKPRDENRTSELTHDVSMASIDSASMNAPKFDDKKNDDDLTLILDKMSKMPSIKKKDDTSKRSFFGRMANMASGSKAKAAAPDEWDVQATKRPLMNAIGKAGGKAADRPLIVIDWDDTIVPTTFIQRELMASQPSHIQQLVEIGPHSKEYPAFTRHALVCEGVFRAFKKVGHVAILTLAKKWWVDASVEKYFPGIDMEALLDELDIKTYHADRDAENVQDLKAQGHDVSLVAKRAAFSACLKDFYSTETVQWNVMSVGDAMVEHDALKAVLVAEATTENSRIAGRPLCKTVKLIDNPTLEDLTRQLEAMLPSIRVMVESDKSFHRELV